MKRKGLVTSQTVYTYISNCFCPSFVTFITVSRLNNFLDCRNVLSREKKIYEPCQKRRKTHLNIFTKNTFPILNYNLIYLFLIRPTTWAQKRRVHKSLQVSQTNTTVHTKSMAVKAMFVGIERQY